MEATRPPVAEVDIDEELPSYLDVLNDIPPVPEGVNTSLLKRTEPEPQAQGDPAVEANQESVDEAPPSYEEVVSPAMQQLLDMGISQEDAEISLYRCNGNVEEAILFCQEFLCVDYGAMDGTVTLGGTQRPSKLKKFMRKMTTKARKSLTGPSVLFPKSSASTSRSFGFVESTSCSTPTSAASLRHDSFQSSILSEPQVTLQRAASQETSTITEDHEAPPDYMEIFTPPTELGAEDNEMPPGYEDVAVSNDEVPELQRNDTEEDNEGASAKLVSPLSSREPSPRESFIPSMRILAIPAAEGCADSDDEASIVSMISAYSKTSKHDETHTPTSVISSEQEVNSELQRLGSDDAMTPEVMPALDESKDDILESSEIAPATAPEQATEIEQAGDVGDEDLLRELEALAEAEREESESINVAPTVEPIIAPAVLMEAVDPFSPAAEAEVVVVEELPVTSSNVEPASSAPCEDVEAAPIPNDAAATTIEAVRVEEKQDDPCDASVSDNDEADSTAFEGMQFDEEELLRELQSLGMDVNSADEVVAAAVAFDTANDCESATVSESAPALEPVAVCGVVVPAVASEECGSMEANDVGDQPDTGTQPDGFDDIAQNIFDQSTAVVAVSDGFDELPPQVFAVENEAQETSTPVFLEASAPPAIDDVPGSEVALPSEDRNVVASDRIAPAAAEARPEPAPVAASVPAAPMSVTPQRPAAVMTTVSPDEDSMQPRSGATTPVVAAVASTVSGDDDDVVVADTLLHVNIDPHAHNAVAGSYLRSEQGECYVSVATLLEEDDESRTSGAALATLRAEEEARRQEQIRQQRLQEQSRGLFGYVSTALYGADVADESMNRGRTAKKRVLLSYDVSPSNGGAWTPRITTKQVKLRHKSEGPQGSLPDVVTLPVCATQEQAQRLCEATTPPLWAGGNDKKECVICFGTEGIFNKLHHCRNCGYYVCKKCSSKSWPASMVPTTYIKKENFIRVCDSCSCLVEAFVDGLVTGDMTKTMAIYSSGNVNLYCPFSIYKSAPYPVHCAAQGGNLDILRWLLEDRMCPIKSRGVGSPLMTTEGMSVFAIAAYYGHVSIMRYVVHRHGAAVTEISEVSVLHRALHAALEAPGPLPDTASSGKGILRMKRRAIPREAATDFDAMDDTIRGMSSRHGAPPVEAQLATGNRNLEECVSTTAEEYNATGPRHKKIHKSTRAPNPAAVDIASNTVRTLVAALPPQDTTDNMSVTSGGSVNTATASVGAMHAIVQPYRDEDVTVLTARSSHGSIDTSRNGSTHGGRR